MDIPVFSALISRLCKESAGMNEGKRKKKEEARAFSFSVLFFLVSVLSKPTLINININIK